MYKGKYQSECYDEYCERPSLLLSQSSHNVVLDLDQTLVCTQDVGVKELEKLGILSNPSAFDLRQRIYVMPLNSGKLWGIVRPHTREFLEFCFQYFCNVAVWSAGKRDYVHSLVDYLFRDLPQPCVVYTYDNCAHAARNGTVKPLPWIFRDIQGATKENTFIIDDNENTFQQNLGNAIHIPEFQVKSTIKSLSSNDDRLREIMDWLMTRDIMEAEDITEVDKSEIFT